MAFYLALYIDRNYTSSGVPQQQRSISPLLVAQRKVLPKVPKELDTPSRTNIAPPCRLTNAGTPQFGVRDRVVLHGLVKAPQWNGGHGVMGAAFDETSGRYDEDLDLLDAAFPKLSVKTCQPKARRT